MKIQIAIKNEDKLSCFFLLQQLVKELEKKSFYNRLKEKRNRGYKLIILKDKGDIIAVAGIRFYYSYVFGKYLEIEDFVVDKNKRRQGYGSNLFNWIIKYANKNNCNSIQLNSRIKLKEAHKFYEKMKMNISHYRYIKNLK